MSASSTGYTKLGAGAPSQTTEKEGQAHGRIRACAQLGGVQDLPTSATRGHIRKGLPDNRVDGKQGKDEAAGQAHLPRETQRYPSSTSLSTLDQVISVDYYLPGCPPPPKLIFNAVDAIAKASCPKGSILAPSLRYATSARGRRRRRRSHP